MSSHFSPGSGIIQVVDRFLNVVDLEATCWADKPPPGQVNEIIEIGVCVLDIQDWSRVDRRSILVRPERSQVSPFCTQLTSLTQAQVDSGVSFAEACELLRKEFHSDSRPWGSWGDYDRKQFEKQCVGQVRYPFGSRHTNLKAVFSEVFGLRRRLGMKEALDQAGLPLEGRHHRGDDDAWNIAALAVELAKKGWTPR